MLGAGQSIEDLDLWPGDRVILHDSWILLGEVNSRGLFVSHLDMLN